MNQNGLRQKIRFSSDFDGKFNFTAGYYYNETGSETDYHIKSPSLMYYGNTNNGPHCVIFQLHVMLEV